MDYRYSMRPVPDSFSDWPDSRIAGGTSGSAMIQQTHRLLAWLLLLALLSYVSYLSFRAYLSPDFLIGFANQFSC